MLLVVASFCAIIDYAKMPQRLTVNNRQVAVPFIGLFVNRIVIFKIRRETIPYEKVPIHSPYVREQGSVS